MIIGRHKELKKLDDIFSSSSAEFVAVYGRRRVGKTYLIREYFKEKDIYIEVTGKKDGNLADQLASFAKGLEKVAGSSFPIKKPENWKEAFELFTLFLEKKPKNKKVTLFLDELPWLCTPRSNLMQELDFFWNTKWSQIKSLILVVCGSAASWILDNLINAKGGLHNRITQTILLEPFLLKETKEYLNKRGIHFDDQAIVETYMVTGGVAYYLNQVKKGHSPTQFINEECFKKDGLLNDEFNKVFSSLFSKKEKHVKIVREIARSRQGISRDELIAKIKSSSGGAIDRPLGELASSGFIQKYIPYKKTTRETYFRLIDEYTLFYLKWIEPIENKNIKIPSDYWALKSQSPSFKSWAGYTFETLCQKHVDKILEALGISGIACDVGTWRYIPKNKTEKGVQVDLVLDRADRIITLCEIKYAQTPYILNKADIENMQTKVAVFKEKTKTPKMVNMAIITPLGLKQNSSSSPFISREVTLQQIMSAGL